MKHVITKEDLKAFLKENPILIEYTKDKRGFKNGVIVAIGREQLGFSKVHPNDHILESNLRAVPALQRLMQAIERDENLSIFLMERKKEAEEVEKEQDLKEQEEEAALENKTAIEDVTAEVAIEGEEVTQQQQEQQLQKYAPSVEQQGPDETERQ